MKNGPKQDPRFKQGCGFPPGMPSPLALTRYLQTRAVAGPWRLEGDARGPFAGAVVIPSLAEEESLFATLASLARNPAELLAHTLVVVVVNHRQSAAPEEKAANREDLRRLAAGDIPSGLRLAWVDAASPGRELAEKGGGVGLARKIGFDLALPLLGCRDGLSPILVSLDADTLVTPDYLPALVRHFRTVREGGAVIPFRHQPGESRSQQEAIDRYEIFLRHYALGLSLAGSPYAFHTVGSAMACTAGAYVMAGGMNRRSAGEDFYFLQQLAKVAGVAQVRGAQVYPSARISGRTPFGTGPSVARLLAGEREAVLSYHPACFEVLGAWLDLATGPGELSAAAVLAGAGRINIHLREFLEREGFAGVWTRLQGNHSSGAPFRRAFHGWFDGLKTLRLIHHLSAGPLPRLQPEQALPPLLALAGTEPAANPERQLALLRRLQEGAGAKKLVSPARLL